jgi:hypothetical protein
MKKMGFLVLSVVLGVSAAGYAQRTDKPAAAAKPTQGAASAQPITVWRTATCGCCGKWVDHLKAAGFAPTVHIVQSTDDSPATKGVPAGLRSCHSATLEGYNVEGHVPADVIRQLLKERPKVAGIAVPGMPAGSPGMESPTPQTYDIIAYDQSGKTSVFATRGPQRR